MLKSQDVVVLLKIWGWRKSWTYSDLAQQLRMSASGVHGALKRCEESRLYNGKRRRVLTRALAEFLVHGVKYAFPAQPGPLVRGLPTAHSAEPLRGLLSYGEQDIYVWGFAQGTVKGQSITPLYPSVPEAVRDDLKFYELLCLVDALRVGRVREQALATTALQERLLA